MLRGQFWLSLAESGRVQDPCKFPSPGRGFGLLEKRNLRLVTVCEPCAQRSLWQKWGWNWKATLNCLNHSPNSLFLQLTSGVKTCRFTAQIAAAGCNGITGCCSSSDLPCSGAVVLWQGLPELQEEEWQPMLPCKVPWSPFLWLCFLQPIASHVFDNYSTSLPRSLPQSALQGSLSRHLTELVRAATACGAWPSLGLLLLPRSSLHPCHPAPHVSPCQVPVSVIARLQCLLSLSQSRVLSCANSQNQYFLQIQNLAIISNKLWTLSFYFEVHNSTVFLASAPFQNSKRQSQNT